MHSPRQWVSGVEMKEGARARECTRGPLPPPHTRSPSHPPSTPANPIPPIMPPHPDSRTLLTTLAAIALSLAATTLARALATVRARRAALARLPAAPGGGSWAVGHTADMLAPDFHLRLSQWKADLGPIFTIRGVVGSRAVVVADPVSLATAVGARGRSAAAPTSPATPASLVPFPKWRPAYGVMDGVWGGSTPSIFTAAGLTPRWRAVRRATAPCFSAAAIRCHFPLIASRLGGLGDALVAGAGLPTKGAPFQVAMAGACMRLARDVIGMVRGARHSEGHNERGGGGDGARGMGKLSLSLSQNTRPASPSIPPGRLWQGLPRRVRRALPHRGDPADRPGRGPG